MEAIIFGNRLFRIKSFPSLTLRFIPLSASLVLYFLTTLTSSITDLSPGWPVFAGAACRYPSPRPAGADDGYDAAGQALRQYRYPT